ncbi:hypothetical protein Trydic_g23150 [Trypoxylus dichotomus]
MRTLSPVQSSFKTESEWKAMEADNAKNWADDKDSFLKDDASSLRRINQAVTNNVATSENSEESLIRTSKKFSDDNETTYRTTITLEMEIIAAKVITLLPEGHTITIHRKKLVVQLQENNNGLVELPLYPEEDGIQIVVLPPKTEFTENEYDELMANLDSQQMDVIDFGEGQGLRSTSTRRKSFWF